MADLKASLITALALAEDMKAQRDEARAKAAYLELRFAEANTASEAALADLRAKLDASEAKLRSALEASAAAAEPGVSVTCLSAEDPKVRRETLLRLLRAHAAAAPELCSWGDQRLWHTGAAAAAAAAAGNDEDLYA
jgi:hypothetical protein